MSLISQVRHLVRRTLRRAEAERDLDAEVQAYLELLVAEKQEAGLTPAAARRAALLELGGVEQVKEAVRSARPGAVVEGIIGDVRHGVRASLRHPAFTAAIVSTLALGIGGATGIFSIVDAALLQPLAGVRAPERLVTFSRVEPSGTYDNFSLPDFHDYVAGAAAFESLGAHVGARVDLSDAQGAPPLRLRAELVTGGYFVTLGATVLIGRPLDTRDDAPPGQAAVAVLSESLWRGAFGSDPGVVGRTVRLNGTAVRVVGVVGGGFTGTATGHPVDVWLPLAARPLAIPRLPDGIEEDRAAGWMQVFGRLAAGATLAEANAQLAVVSARLADAYPLTNAGRHVTLAAGLGLYPDERVELTGVLRLLFGAVLVVLAIACANSAGLMLVRFGARRREMAARLALGGGPRRLVLQMLIEGLTLSLPAAALGLLLAHVLARLATSAQPASSALRALAIGLDVPVLAFAVASALVTGLAVAVLPAIRAARLSPMAVLREGVRGGAPRRLRLQRALVAGQVALSFVMLAAAAALLLGLYRIVNAAPGFEMRDAAMVSVDLETAGYSRARGETFLAEAVARAAGLPGVRSAALTTGVPPTQCRCRIAVFLPGEVPPPEVFHGRSLELGFQPTHAAVGPGFFTTLGIPLLHGRDFGPGDGVGAPPVAIVNEALARQLWPGEDPIGRRIVVPPWSGPPGPPLEVVGVAADSRWRSLTEPAPPVLYVPFAQNYDGRVTLVVRSARPAAALAEVRRVLAALDPALPTSGAATMERYVAASLWQERMAALWIVVFGVVALGLGAVGLYGVLAQTVVERTRELSIRAALGAGRRQLTALVVAEGIRLGAAGLAIGVPVALLIGRMVAGLAAGAAPPGPATLATIATLLALIVLLAAYFPSRRAARLDPAETLRHQ